MNNSLIYGNVMIQPKMLPDNLRYVLGLKDVDPDIHIAIKEILRQESSKFFWQQCYWNDNGEVIFIGCTDLNNRNFYEKLTRTVKNGKVTIIDDTSKDVAYSYKLRLLNQ